MFTIIMIMISFETSLVLIFPRERSLYDKNLNHIPLTVQLILGWETLVKKYGVTTPKAESMK